jgi:hypothetical protein
VLQIVSTVPWTIFKCCTSLKTSSHQRENIIIAITFWHNSSQLLSGDRPDITDNWRFWRYTSLLIYLYYTARGVTQFKKFVFMKQSETNFYATPQEDDSLTDKDENADSCLFCGKQDSRFMEGDNLDLHFCQQCPMLASCSNCGQIVEISSLKDHYLFECTSGKRWITSQRCLLKL